MGLNFHFFPAAYQDETLHSVLSRYAQLCGLRSCRAAFYGSRQASFYSQNVAFPCQLGELIKALPSGTELSLAEVVKRHTLLPYYAPFLSQQQVEDAYALMAGNGKGLMLRLGLIASRLEFAARVRFCPVCIEQDITCVGAAYWHRVHQLPGVLVCPHHGSALRILDHRWLSRNSRRLHLPDSDDVQSHSLLLDIPPAFQPALYKVAQRSSQILETDTHSISPHGIRSVLLEGAISLDLAAGSGRLYRGRLAQYLARFFETLPPSWEYSVLGQPSVDTPSSWVEKILHKPRRTHHPLKFILLASALGVDMAQLLRISGPAEFSPHRLVFTRQVANRGSRARRASANRSVTDASKAAWARALDGADVNTIALELGLSVTYVYRVIRDSDHGVDRWKEARFAKQLGERRRNFEAEYPSHLAHECRDYPWLYRNDRQWLSEHVQARGNERSGRKSRTERFRQVDSDLAAAIISCAEELRARPGKPVFISRTKVGRELHALSRFEKQLGKLPRCAAALAMVCESIEEFHDRRLKWAAEKLRLEGRPITRSSLFRMANIRSF